MHKVNIKGTTQFAREIVGFGAKSIRYLEKYLTE